MNLLDVWTGQLSLRRVYTVIVSLPDDSAYARVREPWSTTDYLLALVADILQTANWQRSGDKNAKRPTPISRPADVAKVEVKQQSIAEQARAFRARRQRTEG